MPKFTVESPFDLGDRVRRGDGVEFVIERWEHSLIGDLKFSGRDDEGYWHWAYAQGLTLIPPAPEGLKWQLIIDRKLYRAVGTAGMWAAAANGILQGSLYAGLPTQTEAMAVAEEIEAVIARHKR